MKMHCNTTKRRNVWLLLLWLLLLLVLLCFQVVIPLGNGCYTQNCNVEVSNASSIQQHQQQHHHLYNNSNSTVFVFFVGLEGTGHHLVKELVVQSPSMTTLNVLDLNTTHRQLSKALFRRADPSHGLLNAHCSGDSDVNGTSLQETAVRLMQTISRKTQQYHVTVPLNCIGKNGFFSYPTGWKGCWNFPNLDVLYHTCEMANVTCLHVLLFREPHDILHSTTIKRHYNPTLLSGIHVYTTMLQVIHTQLLTHASYTHSCWGLFQKNNTTEMWSYIQHLLGWKDTQEFQTLVKQVYRPPAALNEEELHALVPSTLQPYMMSMMRAHDAVVQLCQQQEQENGYNRWNSNEKK